MATTEDFDIQYIVSALVFIWLPLVGATITLHSTQWLFLGVAVTFYTYVFYVLGHSQALKEVRNGEYKPRE